MKSQEKIFAYLLLFLVAVILQKSLVPLFAWGGRVPDGFLMLGLALAVVQGFEAFLPWALVAGLLYDLAGHTPLGLHALILVLVTYAVSFFSRRLLLDMRLAGVITLAFFVILATFLSELILTIASNPHSPGLFFEGWQKLLIGLLYNLLIFLGIFFVVRKVNRKKILLVNR